MLKDYVAFPLLAGPVAPFVFTGNLTANLIRNVWSYMIIFCGHFPDGTQEFTVEETENETRGQWYLRQMLGSANLTGGKLFHILSGNLSHQIEHHLFPDIPAHRYPEIAPEVQEICERYGLPYNSGPLPRQFGTVVRKIVRLTLPDPGRRPATHGRHDGRPGPRRGITGVPAPAARSTMGPVEWTGARYADSPTVESSTWIDAPPERVWELVSDIGLMPTLEQRAEIGGVGRRRHRAPARRPLRRLQRA